MNDASTEVAAHVATQLIKDTLAAAYAPISGYLSVKQGQFIEKFSSYCGLVHNRSSLVRTLYSKNKAVPLEEVYVKTRFLQGPREFSDNDIINRFASGRRIIIKGNGGSGKTVFLKYLWISRFLNIDGKIPILIELRRLNDLQSIDLISFCRNELQSDMSFGKGVFEKLCEAGRFEFIFDGFDEVNKSSRKAIERQIILISEKYRDCCILVSGREDDRFSSWSDFEIFSVSPMNYTDVRELIEKVPFDKKVKKKFLETLKEEFYNQHRSFLSSPLLAIMMLMTFNENAVIPSKLTEFYKSAFQTLLTWHDATKDSFERDRALSVDNFRRVFATFCLITYYEQNYEFDEHSFRDYLKKALAYHSLSVEIDDVLNDICESANLMQKDGLKYIFVHRSFQEYFAAECAMQVISGKAEDFLETFSRRDRDSVFAMCYEIHPELVFDKFFERSIKSARSSGFLDQSSGGGDKDFWLCESCQVNFRNSEDHGLYAFSARMQSNECHNEFARTVDLARRVSGKPWDENPTSWIFDAMLHSTRRAAQNTRMKRGDEEELKVVVNIKPKGYSFSIRNTGSTNFSKEDTKKFRAKLQSFFSEDLKARKPEVEKYYKEAAEIFDRLENDRRQKERSIDDILGISS
ncbi:MAG: NACHT domain-containing protein [Sagittula sp.]|uniref:NACHT domain-containing protein n=3 Tax=Sagittula sp. TaxID=2038081 RepID=UPI004059B804